MLKAKALAELKALDRKVNVLFLVAFLALPVALILLQGLTHGTP